MAVNALKDNAWRALYAIQKKCFDSVIQPIALYGSEVWGPLSDQSYIQIVRDTKQRRILTSTGSVSTD